MLMKKMIRTVLLGICLLFIHTGNTQKELLVAEISNDTVSINVADVVEFSAFQADIAIPDSNAFRFVSTYLQKNKVGLKTLKKRSKQFFPLIHTVFTKYDLPLELKYLAVVESNLKTDMVSSSGAKGLWQFMATTGRIHGLKINDELDERLHAYKSSVAAAKYLKQLYKEFGDWLLVIAAYNSGPGYVYKAIKRSGSRNFWELQYFLPKETRHHVKKYISVHYYFEEHGNDIAKG